MLEAFYPSHEADSAYDIDYEGLYETGFCGILYDIDNTLVPHGAPADERAVALFSRLHKIGYRVMVISNNKEPRVKSFSEAVGADGYLYKAGKPSKKGYLQAMERMGTNPDSTFFVGDQLFTDVWGAKRAGLDTWLTRPIHPKEEIQIVLKRSLEKIVLHFYHKNRKAGSNDN